MDKHAKDVSRTMLIVTFVGLLATLSVWVLYPFLPAILWASMLVVTTWPIMIWMQARLNGKRSLAVIGMVTLIMLIVILPSMFAVAALIEHGHVIVDLPDELKNLSLAPLPAWVESIPIVGHQINEQWQLFSSTGGKGLSSQLSPYSGQLAGWFLKQVGNLSLLFFNFLLVVFISAALFVSGEKIAISANRFARLLAGDRGEEATHLATQAIRAIALGVIVTAVVQALLGCIGLLIAGVSYVWLLTVLMFVLGVAQIGAAPVIVVVSVSLFLHGEHQWGIFMMLWSLLVGTIDNVVRPLLIKRAAHLPLLLVFAGVIGGMLSFGIVGLFIGPTVLAVAYTLLKSWLHDEGVDIGV